MNQLAALSAFAFFLCEASGSSTGRVVGGTEALPGEVPSIVALLRQVLDSQNFSFHCTGTLIYPHIVLSAAQCFDNRYLNPISWRVRAGSVLHDSDGVIVNVVGIRQHAEFNPVTLENDLALVNLGSALNINNVSPALLPIDDVAPGSGAHAIIAGWGSTSATAPSTSTSSTLQLAHVLVSNKTACETNLNLVGFSVLEHLFCTVGWGAGICHNDIGSPLFYAGRLEGIASFHVGCGFDVFPAVYTAVTPYLKWIYDNVLG